MVLQDLQKVRENEEAVFQVFTEHLGDSTELINDLSTIYRNLFDSLTGVDLHGHDLDNHAFVSCVMSCHYDMNMGLLCLLRGHTTDAAIHTRHAIELASFGWLLGSTLLSDFAARDGSEPHSLSKIFLNSHESNNAFERYRKTFSLNRTVSDASAVFGTWLPDQYDELSKEVHASYMSLALKMSRANANQVLSYFEIDGLAKIAKGLQRLLQIIQVHLVINYGFIKLLSNVDGFHSEKMTTHLQQFEKRFEQESFKRRLFIDSPEGLGTE